MKKVLLEKRTLKETMILFLIVLCSCGDGGIQDDISNESSLQSQPTSKNQNSNGDQSLTLNIKIVENRFGKCNFGECEFE